ncbi:response regulator transcription factor [Bacteroidota bacterium]
MKKVTFLVAIDSYIIRKGIVSILKNISGTELLLDTDSPDAFKNQLKEQLPDFIIISASLYEKLKQYYRELSQLADKTILLRSAQNELGGAGFLSEILLSNSKQEIVLHLEGLANPYLSRKENSYSSILSPREITVLKHVAVGLTNKQIAEKLFLSLHTVTTHRKNIGNKLGIKSVSGLTVYAILNNLISIEDIAYTTGQ